MTRTQRRSKSQMIHGCRKHGLRFRQGRFWWWYRWYMAEQHVSEREAPEGCSVEEIERSLVRAYKAERNQS